MGKYLKTHEICVRIFSSNIRGLGCCFLLLLLEASSISHTMSAAMHRQIEIGRINLTDTFMENKSDWNHPLLYASGSLPSFKLDSNLLNKSRKIESVTGGALRNDVTVWKAEAFLYVSLQYVLYAYPYSKRGPPNFICAVHVDGGFDF